VEQRYRNWRNPEPPAPKPALTPVQAFLALLVVAIAGGAIFLVADKDDDPLAQEARSALRVVSPSASPSAVASRALVSTESEALSLFAELKTLLRRSYARRNPKLITGYAVEGSPEALHAARQIGFLRRNSLLDRTRTETLEIAVSRIAPDEIVIVERAVVRPHYFDDATTLPVELDVPVQRVTIEWALRPEGRTFKIYSALRR
jgi:hypothetical protein